MDSREATNIKADAKYLNSLKKPRAKAINKAVTKSQTDPKVKR